MSDEVSDIASKVPSLRC